MSSSLKDADPNLGYLTRKDTEVKLPRPTRVKNKTPAPVQITAEQILREARERQEAEIRPPKQKITDPTELGEYRLRKRKEFEDLIRRVRWNVGVWIKYAQWEESQKDFKRARSIWERALEVDYKNHTLWLKYAEVEMKNKFINHARNVWDRAVTLLPRVDQLWYKYIHMEEMLGNVAGARQVFERWMKWMPDQQGWLSYIKFELRYNEVERARGIFERFVQCHPRVGAWIRYAKFEMKNGEVVKARNVYEKALEKLADDEEAEQLFVAFAEFEERCKETERARAIYKFALDHIPKGRAEDLYRKFVAFEKQYGDREGIEDAIVGKRRFQYEDEVGKTNKRLASSCGSNCKQELQLAIVEGTCKIYFSSRALYERLLDRTKHLKAAEFGELERVYVILESGDELECISGDQLISFIFELNLDSLEGYLSLAWEMHETLERNSTLILMSAVHFRIHQGSIVKVVAAYSDGHVRVYELLDPLELNNWQLQAEFQNVVESVSAFGKALCLSASISWNPQKGGSQESSFIIGFNSNTAELNSSKVWEFDQAHQRWLPVAELALPEDKVDQVYTVAWAPNIGRPYETIAVATHKGLGIWNLGLNPDHDGRLPAERVALLSGHEGMVWQMEWDMSGMTLATTGHDGMVRLWQSNLNGVWHQQAVLEPTS
ncbi:unnamed protein product [Lupinus luteus]|uniref:Uncharacterized protein n=1 Tax=Lupinus luteus TaxID=3873 RepID=A0AAV1WQT4_LUPLU